MAVDCMNCKCYIRPFEPPEGCYDCCAGKILRFAKAPELVTHFKVEKQIAEKLFLISADDRIVRLSEYKSHLTESEYQSVDHALRNIGETGWKWIQENLQQRMDAGLEVPVPA